MMCAAPNGYSAAKSMSRPSWWDAASALHDTIGPAQDALSGIAPYLDAAKWALLLLTLIGVGVMLWARIDDRQKGLR